MNFIKRLKDSLLPESRHKMAARRIASHIYIGASENEYIKISLTKLKHIATTEAPEDKAEDIIKTVLDILLSNGVTYIITKNHIILTTGA